MDARTGFPNENGSALLSGSEWPRAVAGVPVDPAWPGWLCPRDRHQLEPGETPLVCTACGATYPVLRGIPRFVECDDYAAAFGDQWNRYRRSQLDSCTGLGLTRERLRRCMGDEFDGLRDRHVLEAGCGAGRFTEVLLDEGAFVTSIDLSTAVEANRDNFPDVHRHRVAQADIRKMPFENGAFDFVICLGVIQHTPRPEETIESLARMVRPGGWLVIDHYAPDPAWFTTVKPLVRAIVKRLPRDVRFRATEMLVDLFLPLHRRMRGPVRRLLNRISPILHYYGVYPDVPDALQREWSLLDTHDVLADWYKHRRSPAQIRRTLDRLGMQDIGCRTGGNGVEARARSPRSSPVS